MRMARRLKHLRSIAAAEKLASALAAAVSQLPAGAAAGRTSCGMRRWLAAVSLAAVSFGLRCHHGAACGCT